MIERTTTAITNTREVIDEFTSQENNQNIHQQLTPIANQINLIHNNTQFLEGTT